MALGGDCMRVSRDGAPIKLWRRRVYVEEQIEVCGVGGEESVQ